MILNKIFKYLLATIAMVLLVIIIELAVIANVNESSNNDMYDEKLYTTQELGIAFFYHKNEFEEIAELIASEPRFIDEYYNGWDAHIAIPKMAEMLDCFDEGDAQKIKEFLLEYKPTIISLEQKHIFEFIFSVENAPQITFAYVLYPDEEITMSGTNLDGSPITVSVYEYYAKKYTIINDETRWLRKPGTMIFYPQMQPREN